MKYSIIIPALNEAKLLPGLLNQLASKESKNKYDYEIIVSDGGSSDDTIKIALDKADIVVVKEKDIKQNIAGGRNAGAKYANGDVFIFINADILLPSDIKDFFEIIDKCFLNSKYLAMTCKVKVFPDEENYKDKFFHFIYNNYFRLLNSLDIGMGRGECQVVRKDTFIKVGMYDEKLAAGEDFELFKRIKSIGNILFTFKLCIFESPRRFRKFGYLYVTTMWVKNGLSVLFKNKSISKIWEQVR